MKCTFVPTNIHQSKPLLCVFWNKLIKICICEIPPDLTNAELLLPRHAFYLCRAWRSAQYKHLAARKYKIKIYTTRLMVFQPPSPSWEYPLSKILSQGCSPAPCRGHQEVGGICLGASAWWFMLLWKGDCSSAAGGGITVLPRRMHLEGVEEWSRIREGRNSKDTRTEEGIAVVKTSYYGSGFKNVR